MDHTLKSFCFECVMPNDPLCQTVLCQLGYTPCIYQFLWFCFYIIDRNQCCENSNSIENNQFKWKRQPLIVNLPLPSCLNPISSFNRAVRSWLSIEPLFLFIWKRAFSLSIEIQSHHHLKAHWCMLLSMIWESIIWFNKKTYHGFHSDIRLQMRPFQMEMWPFRWQWEAGRVREPSTLIEQRTSQSKLPVDWMTARFS